MRTVLLFLLNFHIASVLFCFWLQGSQNLTPAGKADGSNRSLCDLCVVFVERLSYSTNICEKETFSRLCIMDAEMLSVSGG